jgi:putative nucleotidyltransferase with HDIG domain
MLVENTSKYAHAITVSKMMAGLARFLGENEEEWRLVGLLHDLDYDLVREDMSKHGAVAAEKLSGKLPETCLHAIKAHDYRAGFKPRSHLDKALIAADSLADLLEKMQKTSEQISANKLCEEFERFSADKPWFKNNVLECEKMGLSLSEFFELCLKSLRESKDK